MVCEGGGRGVRGWWIWVVDDGIMGWGAGEPLDWFYQVWWTPRWMRWLACGLVDGRR